MKSIATFAMRGRMTAAMLATVFAVTSLILYPLSYLSGAIVALVTLRRGAREGALVAVVAFIAMAAVAYMGVGSPNIAVVYAAAVWLPVAVLALVLRQSISLPRTLLVGCAMAMLVALGFHLVLEQPAQWWRLILEQVMAPALKEAALDSDPAAVGGMLDTSAALMTGIVAAAFFLNMVFCLLLARWWQAMLYNPGGFREEFHALRLGRTGAMAGLLLFFVAAFVTGAGSLPADLAMVIGTLYFLPGLALVHDGVAKKGASGAWLAGLYVALLFLPQVLALLALLGAMDAWLDLRRYLNKTAQR